MNSSRYFRMAFIILALGIQSHLANTEGAECAAFVRRLAYENLEISRFGQGAPNSDRQEMANLFLSFAPRVSDRQIQVAFPAFLFFNPHQPQQYGDGQSNANATFGDYLRKPPFVAILTRGKLPTDSATLTFILSQELDGMSRNELEIIVSGNSQILSLDEHRNVSLTVDPEKLGWNSLYAAQTVYFRPVGWNDWFAVQFPQAYVSSASLLSAGNLSADPLQLKGQPDPQRQLREIPDNKNLGFIFARTENRVHGVYVPDYGPAILTSTGGISTRYRLPTSDSPTKRIYLAKDPRNFDVERAEGVVSGTGPHHIGATGEIILNSLGTEPLMTLWGISAPSSGPYPFTNLAWKFTHILIGTWLRPDEAFVSPRGTFHWHLNHLNSQVAAEVFTPPNVPTPERPFGF